jgi:uncharacterized membrane protein
MNYNLHGDGTGPLGAVLILLYLIVLFFASGILLVVVSKGRGRIWGYYMIVIAILMSIAALLIYSSTRRDLW